MAAGGRRQVVVEITPAAREMLNARVTRRLIELELADLRISANPKRPDDPGLSLFYRLLVADNGELRIELWELGEFYGARRVSTAHGDKKLLARHVALATAELAQRLSRAHTQLAKELERKRKNEAREARERAEKERRERWALLSRLEVAWLPRPNAWLTGPRLGFQLNHPHSGRLEVSASWLYGTTNDLKSRDGFEWLELKVAPAYRFDAYDLAAGFDVGVATLAFSGDVSVDGTPGQRQTWAARAGTHLQYEPRLSPRLRLHLGSEAAILLRNIRAQSDHEAIDLGGLWLGVSLGLVLDS